MKYEPASFSFFTDELAIISSALQFKINRIRADLDKVSSCPELAVVQKQLSQEVQKAENLLNEIRQVGK